MLRTFQTGQQDAILGEKHPVKGGWTDDRRKC